MINPYIIILALFTAVGLGTTFWGLKILLDTRKSRAWPSVRGQITCSKAHSDDDELLPDIRFSYTVDDTAYEKQLEFPGGTTPTREFSNHYVDRFPAGATVDVHYDPQRPEQATLEPGGRPGDWLVFAFGLGATLLMIAALLSGV
jgi:hypothetical protein